MKKATELLSLITALVICFSCVNITAYSANANNASGYNDWWNGELDEWYYEDDGYWWWDIGDGWTYDSVPSTHYDSDSKTFYLLKNPGHLCIYTDFFDGHFKWSPAAAPKDVEHIIFTKGVLGVRIGFNDLPELRDVTFLGDVSEICNAFNNCPKLGKIVVYGDYDEGHPDMGPRRISNSFNLCSPYGTIFYSDCSDEIPFSADVGDLTFSPIKYSENYIDNVKLSNTDNGVKISWDANVNTDEVTVKKYYKKNDSEDKAKLFPATYTDSVTDTSVKSGTKYYYELSGCNPRFEITYLSQPVITSCISTSSDEVTVKWEKVEGAKGYYVYRSTTGKKGSWTKTATLKSDELGYTANGLKANTIYYICVKAYSGEFVSAGATKSVTTGVPEITSAKKDGDYIDLTWKEQSDAVYYRVYTRIPGENDYVRAATIKGHKHTSCKVKVASEKGTAVKVRAFYKSGKIFHKKTIYATTRVYKVGYKT